MSYCIPLTEIVQSDHASFDDFCLSFDLYPVSAKRSFPARPDLRWCVRLVHGDDRSRQVSVLSDDGMPDVLCGNGRDSASAIFDLATRMQGATLLIGATLVAVPKKWRDET